jgi:hypothetical protein
VIDDLDRANDEHFAGLDPNLGFPA